MKKKNIKNFAEFISENVDSKEIYIAKISQFFLDNDVEEIDIADIGRSFEVFVGVDEGYIEVIRLTHSYFVYTPSGESEEIEGQYENLGIDDLQEVLDALDDWKTDSDKTMKRAGLDDIDNSSEEEESFDMEDEDDFDEDDTMDSDNELENEHIASLIRQEFTSGYDPYWKLSTDTLSDDFELDSSDYDHIASQVEQGMTGGELISDDVHRGWWSLDKE